MHFHDLRHSAATMLLGMGVHPKVVQELLGHNQISMTMDTYSHVLPTMQKDAMNMLNDALLEQEDDEDLIEKEFTDDVSQADDNEGPIG